LNELILVDHFALITSKVMAKLLALHMQTLLNALSNVARSARGILGNLIDRAFRVCNVLNVIQEFLISDLLVLALTVVFGQKLFLSARPAGDKRKHYNLLELLLSAGR
jgi:hypothetical protein